jgi:catechol 2,3-dioxygenase-like lactoylglutathione lyase family enzyme
MGTRIKHVAICTENYDRMAEFYKTIFGMKKITNGMTDATGNYNPERGHISDGLIGYALFFKGSRGSARGLTTLASKWTTCQPCSNGWRKSIRTCWFRKL